MPVEDLPLSDLYTLDRVCTEYEQALRAGARPRAAEYLDRVDAPLRPRLLEMMRELSGTVEPPAPDRIGRYRILGILGGGGFGRVYLGRDDDLGRDVAVKVLHSDPFAGGDSPLEHVINEASKVARLNHPGIVQVFDIGRDPEVGPFLVLEYIKGRTLEQIFREERPGPGELAGLIERVAEAVHHAHNAGLIHRDLKPSNILIDEDLEPHVTDFGLALDYDPLRAPRNEVAGTYSYMAPEQVRGLTHRIDRRTDVWALGVILYRGLTGVFPFPGRSREEIRNEVLQRDPLAPRAVDPAAPAELSRICLKCLSKKMNRRYEMAADLVADLKHWAKSESTRERGGAPTPEPTPAPTLGPAPGRARRPVLDESPPELTPPTITQIDRDAEAIPKVVPHGPRAFDPKEADDYLVLVPGPRGRDNLPESVRFWKDWAEFDDLDVERPSLTGTDFTGPTAAAAAATAGLAPSAPSAEPWARVGLLYGPSGGGKSSFVRAGLIPRLNPARVECVYVVATATTAGIRSRLLEALRRVAPRLPEDASLVETFAALRRGDVGVRAEKVLVVIDQFEQWLHAHPAGEASELAEALLQCDGRRLQALVLVRDDFWMAVTRFFQALEVPLIEGRNSAAVELPDVRHTGTILRAYGSACDRFTGPRGAPSSEEWAFIETAAAELAGPSDRVVPVRLSVFTEVVRRRDWTPATLEALGGMKGIGQKYLEEAFDASFAPPTYRVFARAAEAVLQALLPPPPSLIRRSPRSAGELAAAARKVDPSCDVDSLLALLTTELKLIAAVDPEGQPRGDAPAEPAYQLAHDYLILPVRHWIERKLNATRTGRARLLLETTSALWADRPSSRRLPSLAEWAGIVWFTPSSDWTPPQRRMMRASARRHLLRLAGVAAAGAALVIGYGFVRNRVEADERLQSLRTARLDQPAALFEKFDPYLGQLAGPLQRIEADPGDSVETTRRRLLATALLFRANPTEQRARMLRDRLASVDPAELTLIREALGSDPSRAGVDRLWALAVDANGALSARLRAAAALARLDPSSKIWIDVAPAVARALRTEERAEIRRWAELLDPVRDALVPALKSALRDPSGDPRSHVAAAEALVEIQGVRHPDPAGLAALVPGVAPEAFSLLVRAIDRLEPKFRDVAAAALERALRPSLGSEGDDAEREREARRQAQTLTALATLGRFDPVWPRLRLTAEDPVRWDLIEQLAGASIPPRPLLDHLPAAGDPGERQAALLVLAEIATQPSPWTERDREAIATAARTHERLDPDPGVHSAAELLLRRLGVPALEAPPKPRNTPAPGMTWYDGPNGHTFAVTGPLEGWVGTPRSEPGHHDIEALHLVRTGRSLAVATTEVTVGQFLAFLRDQPNPDLGRIADYARLDPDCAAGCASWYDAVRYVNWLSRKAGLTACYPAVVGPGMTLEADALERDGYRLPTEREWELFCRAGTRTARPFGASLELVPRYAWTYLTPFDRVQPVGRLWPTRTGLFDVLGNVWEWCHDGHPEPGVNALHPYPTGTEAHPSLDRPAAVEIQGREDGTGASHVRIQRGGAYDYAPSWARSGSRDKHRVFSRSPYNGFRVVRTLRVH